MVIFRNAIKFLHELYRKAQNWPHSLLQNNFFQLLIFRYLLLFLLLHMYLLLFWRGGAKGKIFGVSLANGSGRDLVTEL